MPLSVRQLAYHFLTGSFFMYDNKAIAITLYFFEIKLLLLLLFQIISSGS